MSRSFDYSLYLVTSRELLPAGKSYVEFLEESIRGGVTIVQVREKLADTREFLSIATLTRDICRKWGIPIIINDRIDIALAIEADGVHLGQSDMPLDVARKLLPPGSVIGISVNTPQEAYHARESGADYIGIGALWDTTTKKLTSPVVGVRGVGQILEVLKGSNINAVAIGGINSANALRTLHGAVAPSDYRTLDGVAVVSDIVTSTNHFEAARRLSNIVRAFKAHPTPPVFSFVRSNVPTVRYIVEQAGSLLRTVKELTPLIHQITNTVVSNQSANATLALGASPIMANAPEEMSDLSNIIGSLLVNIGTINESEKEGMILAGQRANANRKPVILDPVAVGATDHRRNAVDELLNLWQPSVIKGNAGEIGALANSKEVRSRGVDSIGPGFAEPSSIIRSLARKERCIIVMTGETDWLSDGDVVLRSTNGSAMLGSITGSGCMAGTCLATFCAAASLSADAKDRGSIQDAQLVHGNMLIGALGGLLALSVASEIAAMRSDVKGTGTFLPALIDELYNLTPMKIIDRAKVEIVQ